MTASLARLGALALRCTAPLPPAVVPHTPAPTATGNGENLYASTGAAGAGTCTASVASWYDEIRDWDFAAAAKKAGATGATGHFTQVVWRASAAVGCGVATCTSGSPFGPSFPTWALVVW